MRSELTVRAIEEADDEELASIIRDVMTEYGSTGPGSSIHDPEIDSMSAAYASKGAAYFVVTDGERVCGGGGIGPLAGGDGATCELRKMYLVPEVRGRGFGRRIVELCLDAARRSGYHTCYLETMSSMKEARILYERMGFKATERPLGDTGHLGCDAWMRLEI
jgi:putative acetyltransferase